MGTEVFAMAPNADQLLKQVPWLRSSGPVTRTANSGASICGLAPSHHGETGGGCPSSAEAFRHPGESERVAISEEEETCKL